MKICIVSSSGGHLIKSFFLRKWWENHDRLWITRDDAISRELLQDEEVLFGFFPEIRNGTNFLRNLFFAIKILGAQKPDLVFSMGAGIAPPFFLVAKILGIKTVFIETFIFRSKPTLSGRIISFFKLADVFLVQNKKLKKVYPNAQYWGRLIDV
mgnify:CR=1 FL=1